MAVLAAGALFWRARRELAGVPRRVLGYTEHLSPSLSGALSSVDLGLMYDVLLARRWGRGAHVRTRTGGPLGWRALVHRDLLRAARTPQPFVVRAGAGSGKTTSLIKALDWVISEHGASMRAKKQKVACITYTDLAAKEILADVNDDPLVHVSTIHSFYYFSQSID